MKSDREAATFYGKHVYYSVEFTSTIFNRLIVAIFYNEEDAINFVMTQKEKMDSNPEKYTQAYEFKIYPVEGDDLFHEHR